MRGIARIEQAVRDNARTYLTLDVFESEKRAATAAREAQGREIADLRGELTIARTTNDTNEQKLEAQRGRNRLFIYGLIAAPIVTVIANYILQGGLVNP